MRTDASGQTTMSVIDERKLLRACLSGAPDATLAQIVQRHVDLVYAAASRQVRDPHLAEDVTQAVFLVLCRKPGAAQRSKSLAGWLLTVTRYTAVDAMRRQMRQQRHEQAAARPEATESSDQWAGVAPVLDEALAKLKTTDRDAVVLRFFQDKPLAEVGRALGIGEEAARKRVARALERLRNMLSKRGVQVGLAALGTGIAANATQAAPPHVAAAVTPTALGGAASASGAVAALARRARIAMVWAKAKLAIGLMSLIFIACGAVAVAVMKFGHADTPVRLPDAAGANRGAAPVPDEMGSGARPSTGAGVPQDAARKSISGSRPLLNSGRPKE